MKKRVVITGIGVISPVGKHKDIFWKALCEGKSGIDRISHFDPKDFDSQIAGEVRDFVATDYMHPKEIKRSDKFVQFAIAASDMAIKDSGLDMQSIDPFRAGVVVGSGIGGIQTIQEQTQVLFEKGPSRVTPFFIPMIIVNMAAGMIAIKFALNGPNSCSVTACASSNHSMGEAFRLIQYGYSDIMLAGGTEAAVWPLGMAGFCAAKSLSTRMNNEPHKASRPFDVERDGFVMGEGAGIVILEEYEHARKRGANIYAEVIGYGMSCDAYHMTAPDPDAKGAIRCMRESLKDAGIGAEDVNYINAHGTSTKLNDIMETKAIKAVFGTHAKKVMVSSTKSMTGHLLGAAGGVEMAACLLSIRDGIIPPTINLDNPDPECDLDYVPKQARRHSVKVAMSNSLGFGGHNATIIVRKI